MLDDFLSGFRRQPRGDRQTDGRKSFARVGAAAGCSQAKYRERAMEEEQFHARPYLAVREHPRIVFEQGRHGIEQLRGRGIHRKPCRVDHRGSARV